MPSASTLSVTTSDRNLSRSIAGALQDLIDPPPDALTVFEDPGNDGAEPNWRIDAYYASPPDPLELQTQLQTMLDTAIPVFSIEAVPDLNWVAISQAALPPVTAGRFTIHGSHDRDKVGNRYYGIEIEAGEAFGTAHHATTFGCLMAIDRLTRKTPHAALNILDLGCGSGILAIALAKCWPSAKITATDIDPQSCVVARENADHNKVGSTVNTYVADGADDARIKGDGPFDIIIANILAGPLISIAKDVAHIIKPGGDLILSGILVPQAASVIAAYRTSGFTLQDHQRITGWSTITLVKRI